MNFTTFSESNFYKKNIFEKPASETNFISSEWVNIVNNYDNWFSNNTTISNSIPHIFHQIWLGSVLPVQYKFYCDSWKKNNPSWEYKLWDDQAILALENFKAKKAFQAAKSFGLKSDIARYEILRQFGGIYADTDFVCIKSFDDIADSCSLLLGNMFDTSPNICNAIIGASPNHPFIDSLCNSVIEPLKSTEIMDIINFSGPGLVTKQILSGEHLTNTDIIFPSTYFYPFPNFKLAEKNSEQTVLNYCTTDSYAIHYWDVSWSKVDFLSWLIRKYKRCVKKIKYFFSNNKVTKK